MVDPNTLLHDTNVFGVVRMVIKNQKDTQFERADPSDGVAIVR
jgi:hypothetical protein